MPLKTINNHLLVTSSNKLATGDDCCCGCPCGATAYFGPAAEVTLTFHFANGSTCTTCMWSPSVLYRQNASLCEYYASYTLTDCYGANCTVRVFWLIHGFPDCDCNDSGSGCTYTLNGWTLEDGLCSVTAIDQTEGCFV